MPFVKIDTGILNSSIWPDHILTRVFLTALLMAVPEEFTAAIPEIEPDGLAATGFSLPSGWYGFVQAAGPGIIRQAGVPEIEGYAALTQLAAPDKRSRSADYEGRRLVRIDGGYLVINYMTYRERDYTAADRSRRYREKRKKQPELLPRHAVASRRHAVASRNVTHAEAEAEAEADKVVLANHPGLAVVLAYFAKQNESMPVADRYAEKEIREAWLDLEGAKDGEGHWLHWQTKRPMGDWRAGFESRMLFHRERKEKSNDKSNSTNHPARPTRNDGTLNAGKASQYRGVGRVVQLPDNGGTAT